MSSVEGYILTSIQHDAKKCRALDVQCTVHRGKGSDKTRDVNSF